MCRPSPDRAPYAPWCWPAMAIRPHGPIITRLRRAGYASMMLAKWRRLCPPLGRAARRLCSSHQGVVLRNVASFITAVRADSQLTDPGDVSYDVSVLEALH